MNIRIVTIGIFLLIIAGGLGFYFLQPKNPQVKDTKEVTKLQKKAEQDQTNIAVVTSSDNRVSFSYPDTWTLLDMTGENTKGKFGTIIQAWEIQNAPEPPKAMTANQAKITITIESGGSNLPLDRLVDCSMKTIRCDKIGIDNEQFLVSNTVLNSGAILQSVGTFYDDKILLGQATVTPGSESASLNEQVTDILHSFKFSDPTVND